MNATQQAILKQANLAMVDAFLVDGTLGDEEADNLVALLLARNAKKVQGLVKGTYAVLGLGAYVVTGLALGWVAGFFGMLGGVALAAAVTAPQYKLAQLRAWTADDLGAVAARAAAMGC